MKYYLIWILTRTGEFEFIQPTSTALPPETTLDERIKDIVINWYDIEEMEYHDSDGVAWFHNGNAVECDGRKEITQSEYETFQKYSI